VEGSGSKIGKEVESMNEGLYFREKVGKRYRYYQAVGPEEKFADRFILQDGHLIAVKEVPKPEKKRVKA
jgi:hypothetical protein